MAEWSGVIFYRSTATTASSQLLAGHAAQLGGVHRAIDLSPIVSTMGEHPRRRREPRCRQQLPDLHALLSVSIHYSTRPPQRVRLA